MKKAIILFWAFALSAHAGAINTFIVTNELDAGPGSLRDRIGSALTSSGENAVTFQIPPSGGVRTINILSPLQAITNTTYIDATTQAGYSNSPLVRLVSAGSNVTYGLRLHGGSLLVRGLYLTAFSNAAIEIAFKGGTRVLACSVVTNYRGIVINDVGNNIIGGYNSAAANVIGANTYDGVEISGENADNNLVAGNYIGVQPAGAGYSLLSNNVGVAVYVGDSNIIRGSVSAPQIISGSSYNYGVTLAVDAMQNRVEGNYIGTDPAGSGTASNSYGVYVTSAGNIIGGTAVSNRNIISKNSIGVYLSGSEATGNQIAGNYFCVDSTGTASVPGSGGIRLDSGASGNFITGSTSAPQIIAGCQSAAIFMIDPSVQSNVVAGNTFGLTSAGTILTNNGNVVIYNANNNRVGGTTAADRNIIAGSQYAGVEISAGSTNNVVQGNYIGIDAAGVARGNAFAGVYISDARNNVIGGNTPGARNVISGNNLAGIYLAGSVTVSNRVQGNYIGTDPTGVTSVGNKGEGIWIEDSPFNTIGGSSRLEGNLISGNASNGVYVTGTNAHHTLIAANFIGTDAAGTGKLSNKTCGITFLNTQNNTVGGTTPGERNVISGNAVDGIAMIGNLTTGTVIIGNFIGVASNGLTRLGNGPAFGYAAGVKRTLGFGIDGNTIGGATPSRRNIISGNLNGIILNSAHDMLIQGNYIGVGVDGVTPASNNFTGIQLDNISPNNRIQDNVISGNGFFGVEITDPASTNNVFERNRVGLQASSNLGVGNGIQGIRINGGNGTRVGSTNAADGNIIAFNGGAGVAVFTNIAVGGGAQNAIYGNLIYSNGGLAIDIGSPGVTANDPAPDADVGANGLQNFPVITNAAQGSTILKGVLVSGFSQTYRCEFFATNVPQGMIFLGATNITTSASGTTNFLVVLSGTAPSGSVVIATATDPNGNTSEMGPGVTIVTALDADHDGMWDAWEIANFGSTNFNGTGDNDGDGRNNYYEFVSDTSPTNAASFFKMASITNGVPHYPGWVSSGARWYDVEFSTNMASPTWTSLSSNVVGVGGVQTVPDAADSTNRIYRARVKLP